MKQDKHEELLQLIKSTLTAIDGLWFLECEKEFGFEKAFEIDLGVWKKYGAVMTRRIAKMLGITLNANMGIEEIIDEASVLKEVQR